MEACAVGDQLSEDLFHGADQIAQLNKLKDIHSASALAMALRKLNTSFIRATGEAVDLRNQIATLEAEREEAWATAENVERELINLRANLAQFHDDTPPNSAKSSRRSSRVSAARKTSMRASKASLRLSLNRKSRSSSIASSRYASVISPSDPVPPVPPMPLSTPITVLTDWHRHSVAASSFVGSSVGSIGSPTAESKALAKAQQELLDMLGISAQDIGGSSRNSRNSGHNGRPRSASDAAVSPRDSNGSAGSFVSPLSPPYTLTSPLTDAFTRGSLLKRAKSERALSSRVSNRPDSMLIFPPRDGYLGKQREGILEDPEAIFAVLTLASD